MLYSAHASTTQYTGMQYRQNQNTSYHETMFCNAQLEYRLRQKKALYTETHVVFFVAFNEEVDLRIPDDATLGAWWAEDYASSSKWQENT